MIFHLNDAEWAIWLVLSVVIILAGFRIETVRHARLRILWPAFAFGVSGALVAASRLVR